MTVSSIWYKNFMAPCFSYIDLFIPSFITPNMITISGLMSLIVGKIFYADIFYLFYALYVFCDFIDGIHARRTKQTSRIGDILDHVTDGVAVMMVCDIFANNDYGVSPLSLGCFMMHYIFIFVKAYDDGELNLLFGSKYFSIDEVQMLIILTLYIGNTDIVKMILVIIKYITYATLAIDFYKSFYLKKFSFTDKIIFAVCCLVLLIEPAHILVRSIPVLGGTLYWSVKKNYL